MELNNSTRRRNILPPKAFAKRILIYFLNILPPKAFAKRILIYFLISFGFMAFSLLVGVLGYHYIAELDWVDSFYLSSMILTGMGPTSDISCVAGKIFSSFYALFSGIVFLTTAAIFISPIAHRLLHLLHVEDIEEPLK